jgi:hypothetical protein
MTYLNQDVLNTCLYHVFSVYSFVNCLHFTLLRSTYFPKHFIFYTGPTVLHQMLQNHVPRVEEMTALEASHSLNTVLFPCGLYRPAQRVLVYFKIVVIIFYRYCTHIQNFVMIMTNTLLSAFQCESSVH